MVAQNVTADRLAERVHAAMIEPLGVRLDYTSYADYTVAQKAAQVC